MKKTAIQQAIDGIELQANDYKSRGEVGIEFSLIYKADALFDSLNLLRALMPIEKEQIKDARKNAIERYSQNSFLQLGRDKECEDYYTQTFTPPSTS